MHTSNTTNYTKMPDKAEQKYKCAGEVIA